MADDRVTFYGSCNVESDNQSSAVEAACWTRWIDNRTGDKHQWNRLRTSWSLPFEGRRYGMHVAQLSITNGRRQPAKALTDFNWTLETRILELPGWERSRTIYLAIWTHYTDVTVWQTERQTDGQTDGHWPIASTALSIASRGLTSSIQSYFKYRNHSECETETFNLKTLKTNFLHYEMSTTLMLQ